MLVHWWLSIPLISTVRPVLIMTCMLVPAAPPLASLSVSDKDWPDEALWYSICAKLTECLEFLDKPDVYTQLGVD
jgi:hypothetical protein